MPTDPTGYISHEDELHRSQTWKRWVRVATTASITIASDLNAGDTIDGVVLAAGDRVLVKNQGTGSQNGIYVAGATPSRAFDMDQDATTDVPASEVLGAVIHVIAGSSNGGKLFRCTNTSVPVLGTTALTFAEITTGGGSFDFWYNVEDYGAVHDGTTDDTVAIQAAIDACMTDGGGTVFFPNGIYAIEGALQDTGTYNSQLEIPNNAFSGANPPAAIRFLGMGPNAQRAGGPVIGPDPGQTGAILVSDWAGVISGTPAVIAAGPQDVLQGSGGWNYVQVRFENIEIRTPANPKLSGIQMTSAAGCSMIHAYVTTNAQSDDMVVPTNSNAVGLDMPRGLNDNAPSVLDDFYVDGFYIGIRPSEQSNGSIVVGHCTQAIVMRGQVGSPSFTRHGNHFDKVLLYACPRGIVATGDIRWLSIDYLQTEKEDPYIWDTIYDIDDASNFLRGFIRYHASEYSDGPIELLVNGGGGLSFHAVHHRRWKLTDVVEIPEASTNPATNPASGGYLYADDNLPHWRSSAGNVYDLTEGTPAGAAGGDLSGTYPNPSVVDDSHSHTSATAPGGGGQLLISDTPSTPLVFADLIQNEAQDDLVYSD